jgi:hypothetical protein
MRRIAFAAVLLVAVGCRAQVPPNPTVFTCPPSSGTAYTPLNQSNQATGLTYTDTHPAANTYCYVAQSAIGAQVSVPSNIAGPFTVSGSNSVLLTWLAPTTGPAPTGYAISRAIATQATILAPSLVNGTMASVQPAVKEPDQAQAAYAALRPMQLKGAVR